MGVQSCEARRTVCHEVLLASWGAERRDPGYDWRGRRRNFEVEAFNQGVDGKSGARLALAIGAVAAVCHKRQSRYGVRDCFADAVAIEGREICSGRCHLVLRIEGKAKTILN